MIKEEVKEGLDSVLSGSPKTITKSLSINSMILFATGVMRKFAKRVKKFFRPQKIKQRKDSPVETTDVENAVADGGPHSSLSNELKEIVTPILDIVPDKDYEGVFTETAKEIKELSEDIEIFLSENKGKKNPLKLCKRKIINFFAKCFLNVWIRRLISRLRKQHLWLRTGDSNDIARSIVYIVTSWLESDEKNSFVLGFHTVTNDEPLFTKTVSDVIYQRLSPETVSKDTQRNKELYADIKKKAWKFASSMNWFLKSLVVKFAAKVNILSPILEDPLEDVEGANSSLRGELQTSEASEAEEALEDRADPHSEIEQAEELDTFVSVEEPLEEAAVSLEKHLDSYAPPSVVGVEPQETKEVESMRAFVQFLIEKILNHIHQKANIVPQYNDEVLGALLAQVWPQVWDNNANLSLTEESFNKMDKTIHKACKKLGNPNEVLFLLKYSEESIIEEQMVRIAKKLLGPPRKPNIFQRFCSFLG
ncbi:hypothetical protein D4764_0274960 [Takifugu flavidus]|uniref:Uncharacterized protein n=1 Tax=Takifugu flavidus TaxID=433684 RepID=A0A5C6MI47_9TELE|nr:hypothetical protein D4764_0274960 [Takifugu flavidus]